MLKQSVFTLARVSGLNTWLRARSRSAFRIVTYHGVDEQDHPVVNFDRLQVKPDLFARQVASLARTYRIVPLGEAVAGFLAGRSWPDRGLAITFDDGYRNNLEVAAPILQRLGVPATFFVTAGFVEGRARPWWYDLREIIAQAPGTELLLPGEPVRDLRTPSARRSCCRMLEWAWAGLPEDDRQRRMRNLSEICQVAEPPLRYTFLSREEVGQLAGQGFELGPHGDTHCSLRAETAARVAHEIATSTAFIRSVTGREPKCLAWPYGHLPATRMLPEQSLVRAGLAAAVSVATGFNNLKVDPVALRRWDLHGGYSVAAVQARLSGFSSWGRPDEFAFSS